MLITKNKMMCATWVAFASVLMLGCQSTTNIPGGPYQGEAAQSRPYSKDEVAKVRTELAAKYIGENKLDAAMQQLEQAFAANSRYTPAYDMMGVLLQTEGSPANLAKADGYFLRAIELDPNFMQVRNNYGSYLSKVGRYQDAIAQFELAGSALGYLGRFKALENLGMTYERLGDTPRAKQAFLRAIDANQNSALARVELINVYLKEGNSLQAKKLYDELVSMAGGLILPAEVMLQGIKIAIAQNSTSQQQRLSQELLATHPLSEEARLLKLWLSNPKNPL